MEPVKWIPTLRGRRCRDRMVTRGTYNASVVVQLPDEAVEGEEGKVDPTSLYAECKLKLPPYTPSVRSSAAPRGPVKIALAFALGLSCVQEAASMEVVALPTAPAAANYFGIMSTMMACMWYATQVTIMTHVARAVPEVVDVVVDSVSIVVTETAEGSRLVVRGIAFGILGLAAIMIGQIGWWLWDVLARWSRASRRLLRNPCRRRDQRDKTELHRLLGGAKSPVSVTDIFADLRLESSPSGGRQPAQGIDVQGERVHFAPDQRWKFVYSRGDRAGQLREVKILRVTEQGLLECKDESRGELRKYWPNSISELERLPDQAIGERPIRCRDRARAIFGDTRARGSEDLAGAGILAALDDDDDDGEEAAAVTGVHSDSVALGASRRGSHTQMLALPAPPDRATMYCEDADVYTPLRLNAPPVALPQVLFTYGVNMRTLFEEIFLKVQSSICGCQYIADHAELGEILRRRVALGVRGRLIVDQDNFRNSSAKRQCALMRNLFANGFEIRTYKPAKAGFPSMHMKTWILDSEVLLTGSVNLTYNGLENNSENLVAIRTAPAVADAMLQFEEIWERAEQIGMYQIGRMTKTWMDRWEIEAVPDMIDCRTEEKLVVPVEYLVTYAKPAETNEERGQQVRRRSASVSASRRPREPLEMVCFNSSEQ